ncbi:MAG: hypothetical protein LBK95_07750 [Bifidobacteriaceae bacterium]|jgi:hypothetical protein|nr:hypothetical protein [Bifidobacteriaceae bacterium]
MTLDEGYAAAARIAQASAPIMQSLGWPRFSEVEIGNAPNIVISSAFEAHDDREPNPGRRAD